MNKMSNLQWLKKLISNFIGFFDSNKRAYTTKSTSTLIRIRERPLMTSHVFWPFLTYLPTLSHSITSHFGSYLGPPLPTLISDVINGRSLNDLTKRCYEVALFQSLMAKVLLGCGVCLRSLARSLMTHLSSFLGPARWNHFPIQRVRNLSPKS